MDYEQARFNMIEQQIRPADVLDPATLEALALVRRERFVAAAHRSLAFADLALPLPGGRHMLEPRVAARLLQAAAPRRGESVLVIGCGSGYLSALLAVHAESVRSLEINPELVLFGRENLCNAGVVNVTVEQADGLAGSAAHAPFDLIVAAGAVREIPLAWLDQLKPGGRLLAIVGQAPVMKVLRVTRIASGAFRTESVFETQVDALSDPSASRFAF